jgi:hypothetical protein
MALDDVCDKTDAETREQAVKQIADRRSYACEKRRPAPFAERPLDNQHPDRTHRSRYQSAYR